MRVRYTKHLEFRLQIRGIPRDLPRKIMEVSNEHYFDTATKHLVAVMPCVIADTVKEMAVTYDTVSADTVEIITIHPLKSEQKTNRIRSGRWRKHGT